MRGVLNEREMKDLDKGLATGRFVNVWRPFQTVQTAPLAFCDPRTIKTDDLIEVDKVAPESVELGYYMKHRTHQRWYWMSHQEPEDPVLFISWDPRDHGDRAGYPAHGACIAMTDDSGQTNRESIEVRFVVLTHAEAKEGF
ncbi:hypothetical protein QQX98_002828 [Neonectria punicea]|uniref:Uncharacterized protein n=1 Tax=Neonectria punicea TaxID=979145 RepID=A0ABR1HGT7_9HYPO